MISVVYVKPRCRKETRDSFHVPIKKEGAKTAVA
jgi:hypothetical protein